MEKLAVLGVFCSGDGFSISLSFGGKNSQISCNYKTSDMLAASVLELLEKNKFSPKDIGTIAVCIGPGSFTGSRVAVSFAKGFACGQKVKLLPFTTFDYYLYNSGIDVCLVPAFSNLVYLQKNGKMQCISKDEAKELVKEAQVVCPKSLAESMNICATEPNTNLCDFVMQISQKGSVKISDLRPVYLRESQAEIEREKRLKNGN